MQHSVVLNDAAYHFQRVGSGPPLLLLHGFTGSSASWAAVAPDLEPHFDLVMPDLLGHGRTAAPGDAGRYQMGCAAADLIALLDHLGIESAHLLGYSMGGRLALFTALRYLHRFQSLFLESASPGLRTEEERFRRRVQDNALAERLEREGIESFTEYWETLPLWNSQQSNLSAEARLLLRRERLKQRPHGLANSLRGMGTGAQPALWDQLPGLRLPVQLLVGALDTKFVGINQEMLAAFPDARLKIAPNAGHAIHLEHPQEFLQTVVAFLLQA